MKEGVVIARDNYGEDRILKEQFRISVVKNTSEENTGVSEYLLMDTKLQEPNPPEDVVIVAPHMPLTHE